MSKVRRRNTNLNMAQQQQQMATAAALTAQHEKKHVVSNKTVTQARGRKRVDQNDMTFGYGGSNVITNILNR